MLKLLRLAMPFLISLLLKRSSRRSTPKPWTKRRKRR